MGEPLRSRTQSKLFPIMLGCFLALVVITVWESASIHASWSSGVDSIKTGDVQRIRIREGRWRLTVNLKGEVEMTADERSIARVEPESYLEIEERKEGDRFRLEATPGPGGEPEIAWFVNREPAEFDDSAQDWLEGVLPRIYRTTGLDAEGRVERFLNTSGISGILAEIRKIDSDQIQRLYYEQVLAQTEPTPEELESLVRHMGRDIGSDFELRKMLSALSSDVLVHEESASAFVAASRSIGSDFELRQALAGFLARSDLESVAFDTLIDAAQNIGSDYDLAELLVDFVAVYPSDRVLPGGMTQALNSINTDFELRKVLAVALRRPGVAAEELDQLLGAAQTIGSDYDLAELLIELSETTDATLPDSFFRALGTLAEDFHLRRVLSAATKRPQPTAERMEAILHSALDISSDHEMQQLLVNVARAYPINDQVRPAFERAAASIASDHQREQALAAARDSAAKDPASRAPAARDSAAGDSG